MAVIELVDRDPKPKAPPTVRAKRRPEAAED
jgi:hypothetical protein